MNIPIPINNAKSNLGIPILITLTVIIGVLSIYYQTMWSMVSIWYRSDTYAHGFLILPFTLYMIWSKRNYLVTLRHQANPLALLVLCALGFIWLLAELASVQVLAQYALIAMIPFVVCALLGNHILTATAFPLAYLIFAVPFGEILIPSLIEFTADFVVSAVQLSGIPIYREGVFLSLPSGNWSVVEACSGLRYLIASVTLGTLYAYLTYRSLKRRVLFILLAIIVPIIANGMRAYLIVMTGHLSGMRLAVGVDHLVYGWVFFGVVMLLLFWIGSWWREDEGDDSSSSVKTYSEDKTNGSTDVKKTVLMAGAVLVMTSIWPIYATYLERNTLNDINPEINITVPSPEWEINNNLVVDLHPHYVGDPIRFQKNFQHSGQSIGLYIAYFYNQKQGQELINSGNYLVPERHQYWQSMGESKHVISMGSREMTVSQNQLHSNLSKILVWKWYWLDEDETVNPYLAKAILAKNKLLGNGDIGAEIIIAAHYEDQPDEAIPILENFLVDMMPAIEEGLQNMRKH